MLTYHFDPSLLDIRESMNGEDAEFVIRVPDGSPAVAELKKVHAHFEDNKAYTDVLFYFYPHHEIKVIVRREYYAEFLTELLKRKLLRSLAWKE